MEETQKKNMTFKMIQSYIKSTYSIFSVELFRHCIIIRLVEEMARIYEHKCSRSHTECKIVERMMRDEQQKSTEKNE